MWCSTAVGSLYAACAVLAFATRKSVQSALSGGWTLPPERVWILEIWEFQVAVCGVLSVCCFAGSFWSWEEWRRLRRMREDTMG